MDENMIKTEKLTFSYSVYEDAENVDEIKVFKDLNLAIKRGSFTAILGHNGCGKSTLAKHFNAILLPMGGRVLVNGIDTKNEKKLFDVRKSAGMVFQNPDNQIVAAIVEDEVAFAPENLGVPPLEIRKRVDEALDMVGMSDYKLSSTTGLSGGQKQRVAIASILAMEPECIILDEPTAMLDPSGREEVINTIMRLNRKKNMTVVLITHYMDEATKADRVIVMQKGNIIMDDVPKKVFSRVMELKKIGLDVPQVTELMYLLNQKGFSFGEDIISIDEGVAVLIKALKDWFGGE